MTEMDQQKTIELPERDITQFALFLLLGLEYFHEYLDRYSEKGQTRPERERKAAKRRRQYKRQLETRRKGGKR